MAYDLLHIVTHMYHEYTSLHSPLVTINSTSPANNESIVMVYKHHPLFITHTQPLPW